MKIVSLIVSIIFTNMLFAQNLHVNAKFGLGTYKGDLKPNGGLTQSSIAWSLGVRYDLTEHIIGRLNYNRTKLRADDANKNNPRNLNFTAKVNDVAIGAQYQIFSLNDKWWTPYVFVGGVVFGANPYTDLAGTKVFLQPLSTEGQGFAPGIPVYKTTHVALEYGVGAEYALGEDVRVGVEAAFRATNTDYIDDVSGAYADKNLILTNRGATAAALAYRGGGAYPALGTQRGYSAAKDKYYFIQMHVTFRPYVNQWKRTSSIAGMKKGKKVGCPQSKGIF